VSGDGVGVGRHVAHPIGSRDLLAGGFLRPLERLVPRISGGHEQNGEETQRRTPLHAGVGRLRPSFATKLSTPPSRSQSNVRWNRRPRVDFGPRAFRWSEARPDIQPWPRVPEADLGGARVPEPQSRWQSCGQDPGRTAAASVQISRQFVVLPVVASTIDRRSGVTPWNGGAGCRRAD
jgi:hypothetical protein